jgi:hypothetical protein
LVYARMHVAGARPQKQSLRRTDSSHDIGLHVYSLASLEALHELKEFVGRTRFRVISRNFSRTQRIIDIGENEPGQWM